MRKGYKQLHIHIPVEVAKKVKTIAIHEEITLTDLLTEVLTNLTNCDKYKELFNVGRTLEEKK